MIDTQFLDKNGNKIFIGDFIENEYGTRGEVKIGVEWREPNCREVDQDGKICSWYVEMESLGEFLKDGCVKVDKTEENL